MKLSNIINSRDLKVIETNEGLIDFLQSFTKRKKISDSEANILLRDKVKDKVSEFLKNTLLDETWVQKNLSNNPDTPEKCPVAVIDGKKVSDPKILQQSLLNMLKTAEDVVQKLSENIKLRQRLCKEFSSLRDADKADQLYLQIRTQLLPSVEEAWIAKGGKNISSVVGENKSNNWPCDMNGKKTFQGFYDSNKEAVVNGVSKNNAREYANIIMELCDIIERVNKSIKASKIPYWDDCQLSYDDLKYGDEIFDTVYVGQRHIPNDPLWSVFYTTSVLLVSMLKSI